MGVEKRFVLNCLLFATVPVLLCGAFSIPIDAFIAFFGLSILGLILALRNAVKSAHAEKPLRRFVFAQAILGTLAFQVYIVIGFLMSDTWGDQALRDTASAVFAAGSIALAVNLLIHIGRVAPLRSPRSLAAGLASTGVIVAALLWATLEYYAFFLLYVLWIAQFGVGVNRLATGGNARLFAALFLLFALAGLSIFLAVANPFNVRWD